MLLNQLIENILAFNAQKTLVALIIKCLFTLVLQGIADANCKFATVDI